MKFVAASVNALIFPSDSSKIFLCQSIMYTAWGKKNATWKKNFVLVGLFPLLTKRKKRNLMHMLHSSPSRSAAAVALKWQQ